MSKLRTKRYNAAKMAAVLTFSLLAAGCQTGSGPESVTTLSNENVNQAEVTYPQGNTPQKSYLEDRNKLKPDPEIPIVNTAEGSDHKGDAVAESTNGGKAAATTQNEEPQWDASKPILLGASIGESNAEMKKRFGTSSDIYTLEDDTDPIEVHEYKGFAIGLNNKNKIQYIEVYDSAVSTGLSGLRVGDKPDTAVKVLGKPKTQNSYIITYEGKGTLLKIDLDPDRNKIVSIKLLAQAAKT
ncbi:MAG: hypothetical protein ACE3L7_12200 [Candidatus Pristimantibacillus sp.]